MAAALAAVALVAAAACGGGGPGPPAGASGDLDDGRRDAAEWIADARVHDRADSSEVVALGYLERARLGLGSPFRLAEYALDDPRLDSLYQRRVAWAVLARVSARQDYDVDPAALDGVDMHRSLRADGAAHLRLIQGVVRAARDPRAGELAVRLAYALAAAEGSVSRAGPGVAAQAAALARDRELAHDDVRRLLAAADRADADPLALLRRWRVERRFAVEQPLAGAIGIDAEAEAIELAPRLVEAVRQIGSAAGSEGREPARAARSAAPGTPLLGTRVAVRLEARTDSLDPPPQAPIVMAVRLHEEEAGRRSPADTAAFSLFARRARDEEHFAAEYPRFLTNAVGARDLVARVALSAAVALRPYAQEAVWYPRLGGPSEADLETRYGLAAVAFDRDVPLPWRPYYRRMLATSLTDLQRVLPPLSFRGLRVRFGSLRSGQATTLAMHDPRTRTVYFPPATGAGTIAHELAHDLDWQVARRRFGVRGDYATDRATRRGRGAMALSLHDLADGALDPPRPGEPTTSHARRPAEVFARSVDWAVTLALARDGRMDGYLSSVQDGVLTGYGSVRPPDFTGRAGDALVSILDQVAPLPADLRRWYLEHHGLGRPLPAYDLVRMVLEAPIPVERDLVLVFGGSAVNDDSAASDSLAVDSARANASASASPRFAAIAAARDAAMRAIDEWICDVPGAAYDRDMQQARRELVLRAAEARARGIALHRATEVAGIAGRRWVARALFGAPWPESAVDSTTADYLAGLVGRVREIAAGSALPEQSFRLAAAPARCAVAPLAIATDVAPFALAVAAAPSAPSRGSPLAPADPRASLPHADPPSRQSARAG